MVSSTLRATLIAALLMACVATALGSSHRHSHRRSLLQANGTSNGTVYRAYALQSWNTTMDKNLTQLAAEETRIVKACEQYIVRGIIGASVNPFAADTVDYGKIYDFASLADYNAYVACFNNQTGSVDSYITWKSRMITMVNSTALPPAGTMVLGSLANVTISPANFTMIRESFVNDFSCLYNTTSSDTADFDAMAAVNLKTRSTNAYWIGFKEPAMALAFEAANTGNAIVPRYSVNTVIRGYYNVTRPGGIPSDHLEFIAIHVGSKA